MKFLDLIDGAEYDGLFGGQSETVRVGFGVDAAHVIDFFEIDVGEDEFVVRRVDDGRPI